MQHRSPPRGARIAAPFAILVAILAFATSALAVRLVGREVEGRIERQLADTARLISGAHFPLSDVTVSHLAKFMRAEVVVVLGTRIEVTSLDEGAARRFEKALESGELKARRDDVSVASAPAAFEGALVAAAPLPAKGERASLFLIYPADLVSEERARAARPVLALAVIGVVLAAVLGTLLERSLGRQREDELTRLVSALAHELKNPLGAIKLTVETVRDGARDPRDREALDVVATEASRVALLVDELRLLGGGRRPFAPEPVRTRDALDSILALLRRTLEHRGLRVERADSALLERAVLVDPRALQQALLNLIFNAIDASPPGGAIKLRVISVPRGLAFEVEDEGPGVSETLRSRLFQPFVTTKEGGTGLGLALARLVAREHGGELDLVRSRPGSVFRLELPLAPDVPARAGALA